MDLLAIETARYYAMGKVSTMPGPQTIMPRSEPPTILVVDDEPTITMLCRLILEQAGFAVLSAEGSSEALKICTQHQGPIDLLLTDLILPPPSFQLASSSNQFPHVHGYELAVRALHVRKDLRVIIMSGNINQDLAGYGLCQGKLPLLQKPFEPQAMVTLVKQTLHASPPSIEGLAASPAGSPSVGDGWVD